MSRTRKRRQRRLRGGQNLVERVKEGFDSVTTKLNQLYENVVCSAKGTCPEEGSEQDELPPSDDAIPEQVKPDLEEMQLSDEEQLQQPSPEEPPQAMTEEVPMQPQPQETEEVQPVAVQPEQPVSGGGGRRHRRSRRHQRKRATGKKKRRSSKRRGNKR